MVPVWGQKHISIVPIHGPRKIPKFLADIILQNHKDINKGIASKHRLEILQQSYHAITHRP